MKRFFRARTLCAFALLMGVLAGCGEKGAAPVGGGGAAGPFLFFTGSLEAVNAASPASAPTVIEAGPVAAAASALDGDFDPLAGVINNLRSGPVMYAAGGKLFKVSTVAPLTATQFTNMTTANEICRSLDVTDFSNKAMSQWVFSQPASGTCATATGFNWVMVRPNMAVTDSPIALPSGMAPLSEVRDKLTGAITGWLVTKSGALGSTDASFGGFSSLKAFTTGVQVLTETLDDKFLRVDDQFTDFRISGKTLNTSLSYTFHATTDVSNVSDGTSSFATDGNLIIKWPNDASASPLVFQVLAASIDVPSVFLTPGKLNWISHDKLSNNWSASSIPSGGGVTPQTTIPLTLTPLTEPFDSFPGPWIFVEKGTSVVFVRDDGTGFGATPNALAAGVSFVDTLTPGTTLQTDRVFILTDVGIAAPTLETFDGATNTLVATPGTLDSLHTDFRITGLASGPALGVSSNTSGGSDVFFVNPDKDNSMVRITMPSPTTFLPVSISPL